MLAKINRLTENRDFLRIFKTVRPVHTEHLTLRCAQRNLNYKNQTLKDNSKTYQKGIAAPPTRGMARNDIDAKKLTPNPYNPPSRFGFVVSNKIDKRSARRNGLKRRIRAVIEKKLPEIRYGVDVVIQVKSAFDYPYNYENVEREVLEGIKRAGL